MRRAPTGLSLKFWGSMAVEPIGGDRGKTRSAMRHDAAAARLEAGRGSDVGGRFRYEMRLQHKNRSYAIGGLTLLLVHCAFVGRPEPLAGPPQRAGPAADAHRVQPLRSTAWCDSPLDVRLATRACVAGASG